MILRGTASIAIRTAIDHLVPRDEILVSVMSPINAVNGMRVIDPKWITKLRGKYLKLQEMFKHRFKLFCVKTFIFTVTFLFLAEYADAYCNFKRVDALDDSTLRAYVGKKLQQVRLDVKGKDKKKKTHSKSSEEEESAN